MKRELLFKRLGIFKFHDRDGIVDRYVERLLDDVVKNLSTLIIVCNGNIGDVQLRKLTRYTNRIYIRDDVGLDAGAFKAVLSEYLTRQELEKYDEVVFFNDEFYGSFYPFETVFDEMSNRKIDFWGITGQRASNTAQYDYIQTYFYAMRKSMVVSEEFRRFWELLPGDIDSSDELFTEYELFLTHYFHKAGFTWDVLVDTSKYEIENTDDNSEYSGLIDYVLLKDFKCPVIKRMNFIYPAYKVNIGNNESTALAFDYICHNTAYDENMIWDNLLRLYNVKELMDCLNLNYILPVDTLIQGQEESESGALARDKTAADVLGQGVLGQKIDGEGVSLAVVEEDEKNAGASLAKVESKSRNRGRVDKNAGKYAVIMYVGHGDLAPENLEYIANIPDCLDIVLVLRKGALQTGLPDLKERFPEKDINVLQVPERCRDASALLVSCRELFMNYELLCFVHDEKIGGNAWASAGMSFLHNMWHNTLCNGAYIRNVVSTFTRNPRLGFLSPPKPHHAYYFTFFYDAWQGNYEATKALADRLGIACNLSDAYDPIAVSGAFWCRTAALRTLFEHSFTWDDFPEDPAWSEGCINKAVKYIYPYVAQHNGYYSGVLMSSEYAAAELKNLNCFLEDITRALSDGTVYIGSSLQNILESIQNILDRSNEEVNAFSSSYKRVYLYGAGEVARRIAKLFDQRGILFEGFVVDDSYVAEREVSGHSVFTLEEIEKFKDECGIVLAMSDRHNFRAENQLKLYGFKHIWGRGVV